MMEDVMDGSNQAVTQLLERLLRAMNDHDLEGVVSCFADDYVNETPAHPDRGFQGLEQVRRNWTMIFGGVPDVRAQVTRSAVDGDTVWTEWEMAGNRRDGADFLMRGVMIIGIGGEVIRSVRFYMEPVEQGAAGYDTHTGRLAGVAAVDGARS
jgi:ketosteroid isomerase-like protein